ncbi:hypothetical protein OIU78_003658 [Salix suchowensis]|nr:hypothetical protein OIU78_003658 [Salix suchowensis]
MDMKRAAPRASLFLNAYRPSILPWGSFLCCLENLVAEQRLPGFQLLMFLSSTLKFCNWSSQLVKWSCHLCSELLHLETRGC